MAGMVCKQLEEDSERVAMVISIGPCSGPVCTSDYIARVGKPWRGTAAAALELQFEVRPKSRIPALSLAVMMLETCVVVK